MSSYAATLPQAPAFSTESTNAEAEWPFEGIVNRRDLGRGVAWALAIEGAAALVICLAWHLLHYL